MPIQTVTLNFPSINVSTQIGDSIYYSVPTGYLVGGFNTSSLDNTTLLGIITAITNTSISVEYDNSLVLTPPSGSFIFFQKNNVVNTSSLLGYYADVKLENDSKVKAEIFSISSEITESSK